MYKYLTSQITTFRNTSRRYLLLVVAAFVVVSFQNCSPSKFTPATKQTSLLAGTSSAGGTSSSVNDPNIAYSGPCAVFDDSPLTTIIIPSSAHDVSGASMFSGLNFPSVNNISLSATIGHIFIGSANKVEILGNAGGAQINANEVTTMQSVVGDVCVRALKVGSIMGLGGGVKIIAQQIDTIESSIGTIHIYGAVVNSIIGHAGDVCLHDGATVLNYMGVIGSTGNCN